MFIIFFSLLSLITHPHSLLANTIPSIQHPHGIKENGTDLQALLAIKAEISDDPNSVLSSWNNSLHFCQWKGVICGHRHRRVVSLDLSSSKLVGTLSPFVGNLSFLDELILQNNSLRGIIPHQISHLPRLRVLSLRVNSFEGKIPANLSRCLHLETVDLRNNKLEGRIPPELALLRSLTGLTLSFNSLSGTLEAIGIGNMSSSLQILVLHQNYLQGTIPDDIGRLKNLDYLTLGDNKISGTIPTSLFNLSSMEALYLTNTEIHGHLPQDLGLRFPQLRGLAISNTSLSGQVPVSLSNLSKLNTLDFSLNSFTGSFFLNGNNLPNLTYLSMVAAFSLGEATDMSFLDTLTNCTNLLALWMGGNSFTGVFPRSILNFSTSLQVLQLEWNQISGQLPFGLGKFVNLYRIMLNNNHFTGPVPTDLGNLKSLAILDLSYNNFSKEIPSSLGNLTLLSNLYMRYNNLEGSLPRSLGNWQYMQGIGFSHNKLSGVLPVELFRASNLLSLEIGQNNLQGSLPPEISRLGKLQVLDISQNRFSGEIPSTLGGCISLAILNMSGNSFVGSIPESLSPLESIEGLDLSHNNLSGQIPSYFSNWSYLSSLNLSFNNFEGEVPVSGVFSNTTVVSVVGNSKLCGGVPELHLPRCLQHRESKRRRLSIGVIMIISIASVLVVVSSIALCLYLFCSSRKRKNTPFGSQNNKTFFEVSYQMLSSATDGFSPSNLIGVGGFGSVYKGILSQDDKERAVAVKVLNLQNKGAGKSFIAECNALREIRHRNLCKIITVCSSIDKQRNDFKALVYEFMPRGSLEDWLHNSNLITNENVGEDLSCSLSVFQRVSIAIDVASALEYLHVGCATPIIHCDLKPSNILLDDEMTAHVGDFGLAKFLLGASTSSTTNQTSSTQVRGTVGYAAPEYGLGSKVSPEGDTYSFGIIVLEMMTSKKPTDPMFNDGLNLHDFSNSALPDRVMEIVDQRMIGDANVLHPRTVGDIRKMECIKSLIMVGVQCSMALPQERMSISNALNELKSARQNILTGGPRNQIATQF